MLLPHFSRKQSRIENCSKTHVSGNWSAPISSVGVVTNMSPEWTLVEGTE